MYIPLLLILANVIVSVYGFRNPAFQENNAFTTEGILIFKEYRRLITSGFLHTGWLHLLFNMFSLYIFSGTLEASLGSLLLLLIYLVSLVGGNLLALYVHRNDSGYSSVGASGAVCGIIFAFITLFPNTSIGLFLIPVSFPAWVFGLAYVLYAMYGIGTRRQGIGHAAHLGGALVGLILALLIRPAALVENYLPVLAIALPCLVFLYLIVSRPHLLLKENLFARSQRPKITIDEAYNAVKASEQKEIDAILEKIHHRGIKSLSKAEKEQLEAYARRQQ